MLTCFMSTKSLWSKNLNIMIKSNKLLIIVDIFTVENLLVIFFVKLQLKLLFFKYITLLVKRNEEQFIKIS